MTNLSHIEALAEISRNLFSIKIKFHAAIQKIESLKEISSKLNIALNYPICKHKISIHKIRL